MNGLVKKILMDSSSVCLILNAIDAGIFISDAKGIVLFLNKKVSELLGYNDKELLGLSNGEIIDKLLDQTNQQLLKGILDDIKQGKVGRQKLPYRHKQGHLVMLSLEIHPIYDEKKDLTCYLTILRELYDELLMKLSSLINASHSLEEVFQNTINASLEYLGLASIAIFLLNEDKTELRLEACNAFNNKEDLAKVVMKIGENIPGRIALERRPIYVENLRIDPEVDEMARSIHSDKSSIGYPLISKDELLGVIAFDAPNVRTFTEKEKFLFSNIANQVAMAISNALLFSKLSHLSTTDGLTGLYNHRYFQEAFDQYIQKAISEAQRFAVLMIDADHFKQLNDTHGHLVGDGLLKELTKIILRSVRSIDVVARYGGEEIAVLLPNCGEREAVAIAERIRKTVEGHQFDCETVICSISVSIGVALFPELTSKEALLKKADRSLYKAKELGRNRVVL